MRWGFARTLATVVVLSLAGPFMQDALADKIVVYGASDRGWVDEQLRQCRKALSKRERPLQAVAVFEGPPETKERLNVNLPKMLTIDCRRGLDEAALSKFLNSLGA